MSLTGVGLILLAVLATGGTAAATVLLWSRYGRWRRLSRTAGVLLTETLVVLTIGLVVNRHEQFYPSWQALAGDTGTTAVAAAQRAGRLDGELHGAAAAARPWRPGDVTAWRLAGTPSVVVPAHYLSRPSVRYPAVISLVDPGPDAATAVKAAKRIAAVSVVAVPSAGTTGAALATLPADLGQDVRVTERGWALVATAKQAALAKRLMAAVPGRFGALVVVGAVRAAPDLTTAEKWATEQTSQPLAAPLRLPSAS